MTRNCHVRFWSGGGSGDALAYRNTQLLADISPPLSVEPGQLRRQDYAYEREGVCNVFVAYERLAGQRVARVRAQRTRRDWAEFMREVLDQHYPQADKAVLVMDN